MNWVNYLIQLNLYLVLFYTFYLVFLKNETFFNLNRAYLVGAAVFSALLPLIKPEWFLKNEVSNQLQNSWNNANIVIMQGYATPVNEAVKWVLGDYLMLAYLVITAVLVINLVFKLFKVYRLFQFKNHPEAFSFFNKIWVNKQLPNYEEITKHELTHAKQLHSADVLFFELLCIINWFNPVCYFYKKSVKHIHEFIADEQAVKHSNQAHDYAMLLFSKSFGVNPNQLTNNFFNQSILKRRIKMLQKQKSKKVAILKYGLSVPLFLLAMILSSAKIQDNKTISEFAEAIAPKQSISEIVIPDKVVEFISPVRNQNSSLQNVNIKGLNSDLEELNKYLAKTLRYPPEARDYQLMGKVAIQFEVNKFGKIQNTKALTLKNTVLAKEAVRVFNGFDKQLSIASGTYTMILNFQLEGLKNTADDEVKSLGIIKNFAGEVMIVAYPPKNMMLNEIEVVGYKSNKDSTIKATETAIYEVKVVNDADDDKIYQNVEYLPRFIGGLDAFRDFLIKNLKYPARAKSAKVEGRVYCQFVVEKDGSLSNINVVRGIGYGCDEEAIRVLAISPKWNPGTQNGKTVRVSYTIPIFYQLPKEKVEVTPAAPKNTDVEVLPSYPGGLVEFGKFLGMNLRYPKEAKDKNIEGRVYVSFVVEKNGSLTDPKVLRGIGYGCDEEALRVIKLSKNWNPGTQNGKAVRVSYTIPIFFQMKANLLNSGEKPNGNEANNSLLKLVGSNNPSVNPPLIYVDGKEIKLEDLKNIKPEGIESVSILKDDAAVKAYGEKGKNGIVIITSKKKN
jgi:TonB family protein